MQSISSALIPDTLRAIYKEARSVLVLTGAGVSAESGVPTFRGGGQTTVWKGLPFDQISSTEMLERDLQAVWEWFDYRREKLQALKPNPAHQALARWQDSFERLTLVTQNIDGLHQKAGSRDVIELHGNIWRARCINCELRISLLEEVSKECPPICPGCGSHMRPDVVLFGEMLPTGAFEMGVNEAERCDLCFVVGTSAVVYPAAALPEVARSAGAYIVEVNPEPTPLSHLCDTVLQGKAGEILPLFNEL